MQETKRTKAGGQSFSWRALTSVLILLGFLILLISGIMLFVAPPGRVANWTNWILLGLSKKQWTALHVCFSALFLVISVVHIVLNWRPMVGYFKDLLAGCLGFRWEWATELLICGVVALGYPFSQAPIQPISCLERFAQRKLGTTGAAGSPPPRRASFIG